MSGFELGGFDKLLSFLELGWVGKGSEAAGGCKCFQCNHCRLFLIFVAAGEVYAGDMPHASYSMMTQPGHNSFASVEVASLHEEPEDLGGVCFSSSFHRSQVGWYAVRRRAPRYGLHTG